MTLRPALASALLTLLACRGAPSQPAGQRAAGKVAEVKTAENIEVSDDPCPSWDELDLERLAPLPQGGDPSTMEAFERAWDVVRRKFPDPTLGCRDWPALRAEYGAAIARTSGQEEAYDLLNEMLSKLGVSHLHATPPTGLAQQLRPTGTGTLGISWELVDDPSKWRVLVRSLGEDRASWAGLELSLIHI